MKSWLEKHPKFDGLAVGGFIFRLSPSSTSSTPEGTPQILMLRRAMTDSFPGIWEAPGGGVDFEDETILHGLVREVWEETGLRVKNVRCQIFDKDGSGKGGEVEFQGRRGNWWTKFCFLVDVMSEKELGRTAKEGEVQVDYGVAIDDEEHSEWAWFTREEMDALPVVSEQAKEVNGNAFKAFEESLKA
jgi:8-oxo-dGTP pyrophosphatase MutT (NUDIX family)